MTGRQRRSLGLGGALTAALVLSACGGGGQPSETHVQHHADTDLEHHADTHLRHDAGPAGEAAVTVSDRARQPIDGWGISVVGDTALEPLVVPNLPKPDLRRLDRLVFERAGVNLVRVFGPGTGTDRQTGNVQPRRDDPRFAFMRRVRPYGVRFMLTAADAPARLKAGQGLAVGAEQGYANYLSKLVGFASKKTRTPFDYVAIGNEPDNSNSLITVQPGQAAEVYRLLAERLRSVGSPTRLVVGDDTTWSRTLTYARAALDEPGVATQAAAIGSHSYVGSSEEMRAVASLARAHGLHVWQTEWGTGCIGCPDEDTMETALRWSSQIAAALVDGQASAWFAFKGVSHASHGPADGLIVRDAGKPKPFHTTKRFDVFRQYSSVAPPGSHRLATRVSSDRLLAVAFRSGQATAVVLTNLAPETTKLSLGLGSRSGVLSGRRTDSRAGFQPIQGITYAGKPLNLALPAQSVTTFTLQKD
jgi:O-glycosyl hydrolase